MHRYDLMILISMILILSSFEHTHYGSIPIYNIVIFQTHLYLKFELFFTDIRILVASGNSPKNLETNIEVVRGLWMDDSQYCVSMAGPHCDILMEFGKIYKNN